jgi:hypothetical protein
MSEGGSFPGFRRGTRDPVGPSGLPEARSPLSGCEPGGGPGASDAFGPRLWPHFAQGRPSRSRSGESGSPVDPDWIEITEGAEGDLVVKAEDGASWALDPTLTMLLREGMARELVNRIQRLRKDAGLEITDRIHLAIAGDPAVREAARTHALFIAGETLARSLEVVDGEEASLTLAHGEAAVHILEDTVDGAALRLGLSVAREVS